MKRTRGRPRKFDEVAVLDAAADVFWEKGFNGTSLDDLAAAMGMNRPSIYSAFGGKEMIYRKTLARFCDSMREVVSATLFSETDIAKSFVAFYCVALDVYTRGQKPLGCMVISTAVCAAPCHPEVQSDLKDVLQSIDDSFKQRMEAAKAADQLASNFDSLTRARIAQGILHTLSVRARAGESKRQLLALIRNSVELVLS